MEFTSDIFLPYLQPPCPLSCCVPPPNRYVNHPRFPYRYSMPVGWPSSSNQHQLHSVPIPTVPTAVQQRSSLNYPQPNHNSDPKSHVNLNNHYPLIPIQNQANHSNSMPRLINPTRPQSSLSLYTSFGKSSTPSFDKLSDIDNGVRIEHATPYFNYSPVNNNGLNDRNQPTSVVNDANNSEHVRSCRITDTNHINIINTKPKQSNGIVHDKHNITYIDN